MARSTGAPAVSNFSVAVATCPLSWFTDGQKGTSNAGLSCGHVAFSAARIGPFLVLATNSCYFQSAKCEKSQKRWISRARTVGAHSPRGDRAFLSPSGSLLVRGSYVVFPVPRCASDGHFRRTQRRSVSTVGHTFPKTHLTMATQAAVMSAKATKVRTRQSALAAGDNFPALVAFSPRSELRRVGTQALRHLRGVGWARFRPRSGLRDARNVSTTSA